MFEEKKPLEKLFILVVIAITGWLLISLGSFILSQSIDAKMKWVASSAEKQNDFFLNCSPTTQIAGVATPYQNCEGILTTSPNSIICWQFPVPDDLQKGDIQYTLSLAAQGQSDVERNVYFVTNHQNTEYLDAPNLVKGFFAYERKNSYQMCLETFNSPAKNEQFFYKLETKIISGQIKQLQ